MKEKKDILKSKRNRNQKKIVLEIELRNQFGVDKKLLIDLMKLKQLICIDKYKIIGVNETIVKAMKLFESNLCWLYKYIKNHSFTLKNFTHKGHQNKCKI